MSLEEGKRVISGTEELNSIKDPVARVAAKYVFEQLHSGEAISIGHETDEFWHLKGVRTEGHKPDIAVILSDNSKKYYFF